MKKELDDKILELNQLKDSMKKIEKNLEEKSQNEIKLMNLNNELEEKNDELYNLLQEQTLEIESLKVSSNNNKIK